MTIQLPQDFIDQLNTAADSDGIRLPFTAPIVWWKHGKNQFKQFGGVRYFGGWGTNAEEFYAAIGEFGVTPTGFADATFSGNDGDFNVYESRAVVFAPIATRKRWITKESGKGRSHIQMLCMMAQQEGAEFAAWGPIVLSAKGLTTREIETAMRNFESFTSEVRQQVAPGVPPLYFWRMLGTFGKQPEYTKVGSGDNTSMITYPTVYQPEKVTPEGLERMFVGNEVAGQMVQLRKDASDWLGDKQWKQSKEDVAATDQPVDPYLAGGFIPDEEMPF